jgi:IS30 family transposase
LQCRPELYVPYQTVYTIVYRHHNVEMRKDFIACLRQGKNCHKPIYASADRRGRIPEMVNIYLRPPEVKDRVTPGRSECDLIKVDRNCCAIGSLFGGATQMVLLGKMTDTTAESAETGFTFNLNQIAEQARQARIYDRGKEMAKRHGMTRATNVRVYFCETYRSWQRCICGNTNGLPLE